MLATVHCISSSNTVSTQSILSTDFESFAKGDFFKGFMQSVLGNGIFNSDGTYKLYKSDIELFLTLILIA